MNEQTGQTLATGYWCPKCEFFETEDDVNRRPDDEPNPAAEDYPCPACGCEPHEHLVVEVVAK